MPDWRPRWGRGPGGLRLRPGSRLSERFRDRSQTAGLAGPGADATTCLTKAQRGTRRVLDPPEQAGRSTERSNAGRCPVPGSVAPTCCALDPTRCPSPTSLGDRWDRVHGMQVMAWGAQFATLHSGRISVKSAVETPFLDSWDPRRRDDAAAARRTCEVRADPRAGRRRRRRARPSGTSLAAYGADKREWCSRSAGAVS
jgi:hypothetical protein